MTAARVADVVVEVAPYHLDHPFEYRLDDQAGIDVGHRVLVGFAGRRVRGLVVAVHDRPRRPVETLKPVQRLLGEHVWVRPEELAVLRWAAARFGAPLADVLRHALPDRTIDVERRAREAGWYPPGTARRPTSDPAPDADVLADAFAAYGASGSELLRAVATSSGSYLWRPLPGEDLAARIAALAQLALANDRDVLLVVPDPDSPVADAVVRAAGDLAVDLRKGPSRRVAYRRWLEARCGRARVVVGERGAAFTPLERLGLAIVLDEANPALKERRSPRHHAREVVLERARRAGGVGLAIGVVPSAVAWRLLRERRLRPVIPARDEERARRPRVRVVDGAGQPSARMLRESAAAMRGALTRGEYAVVLAALRGEGRALVCVRCGERVVCPQCAASLALTGPRITCEGCGWSGARRRPCPACGSVGLAPLAAGAQRLAAELRRGTDAPVAVLEGYARPAPPPPAVLVMTRGSVLDTPPGPVGAVVLPDIDGALRRASLDAAEDTLRLACAVSSWTVHGHGEPGEREVVVQTRDPEHHAVRALAAWDPGAFWRAEAELRGALRFPPIAHALRLSVAVEAGASASTRGSSSPIDEVIDEVRAALPTGDAVLGPVPRDGRLALLVKSDDRAASLAALAPVRAGASRAGLDLRVDVDPVDAG